MRSGKNEIIEPGQAEVPIAQKTGRALASRRTRSKTAPSSGMRIRVRR